MTAVWRRFVALDWRDRWLLAEAAALLSVAWCGLRLLPFLALRRLLDRWGRWWRVGEGRDHVTIARIAWAVDTVARLPRVPLTCLPRALAADAMLRRRGVVSHLRLGVRRVDGSTALDSHAWVEHDGRVIIGAIPDLAGYVLLGSHRS